MGFARLARALLGTVAVLLTLSLVKPSELLGGSALLLTCLLIDRLACGVEPRFDENCFLVSLVAAYLGSSLRAAGIPPPSGVVGVREVLLQLLWALLAVFITVNSRRPIDPLTPPWVPVFLSLGAGAFALSTYAPAEPFAQFATRACLYLGLTLGLYVGREFGRGCLIRGRGFLLCFYPAMFLGWPLAVMFALVSLLALVQLERDDAAAAAAADVEAGTGYRLVQVAPPDLI